MLIIQSELLILLGLVAAILLALRRRESRVERSSQHLAATESPASGVAEVLQLTTDGWAHHGWVREGTAEYRNAYNTPGLALRQSSGAMELGEQ